MIKDFKSNRPKFILYESEKDIFKISQERLLLVNAFILENYVFYEKFKYWDIYSFNSKDITFADSQYYNKIFLC